MIRDERVITIRRTDKDHERGDAFSAAYRDAYDAIQNAKEKLPMRADCKWEQEVEIRVILRNVTIEAAP